MFCEMSHENIDMLLSKHCRTCRRCNESVIELPDSEPARNFYVACRIGNDMYERWKDTAKESPEEAQQ